MREIFHSQYSLAIATKFDTILYDRQKKSELKISKCKTKYIVMISNSRTDFILHMRFVRHSIGNRTMKLHSTLLCFLCGVFNSPGFGTSSRGNRVMFTFCRSGRVRRYPDCMLLTSFAMEILARRKLGQWEIERHSCAPCCYLYKCCRCLSARQFRIYVSTYL